MRREALFTILLGALLTVSLSACGGHNAGILDTAALQDGRASSGATIGGFEVIRCNADGQFDPAMNPTLKLRLDDSSGEQALIIGVKDTGLVNNVELEVRFDDTKLHAERIELAGIYGASQTVSLTLADLPGKAAIGEYCVNDVPTALNGEFATVYFADGPARTVSANNGPYPNPLGVDDPVYPANENEACLAAESTPAESTARLWWFGAWQRADGNQDSLVTVADITPIGVFFGESIDTNWAAARADYNRNRLVEVADLTPIGQNYDTGTSHYRVQASDDSDGAAMTLVKEVEWGGEELMPYSTNQDDANRPDLYPVWNEWLMEFTTSSTFTWGNLEALDTNGNNMVRLHVTPHDNNGDSTSAYRDIEVTPPIPPADIMAITTFQIRIAGAEGGAGLDGELFDDNNDFASVTANTNVTLTLESISGSFNAEAFDGADSGNWPENMTQADYDTAFDAMKDHLEWTFEHHGAAGFRRTTDWLVLDSTETSPVTGDPGQGTIFPDEDPESDANSPEAGLMVYLPAETELIPPDAYPETADLEVHVYGAISFAVEVDVLPHEKQAQLTRYGDDPENPLTELFLNEDTFVPIQFQWGTEVPSDFTLTGLELHKIVNNLSVETTVTFENISELDPLEPGKFQIRQMGEEYVVFCIVPGAGLAADSFYAFRLFGAGMWSSINYPEDMLGTKPPPPPQDLEVVPQHGWPDIDWLQVFYTDPMVRRNPAMHYDFDTGSLQPNDELAFNDVLRTSGDEFFLQTVGVLWPRVAVLETENPADITSVDDGMEGPIGIPEGPGRLKINVATLSQVGLPSDPVRVYAFKWFNADGTAVGQGVFDMAPIGNFNTKPLGKHWGVNVFDREELELNNRVYNNFVTDGSTVGSARPDVLWFEFGGGWVFNPDQDEKGTYATYPVDGINLMVHCRNSESNDTEYMEMALRVVGLGATGDYLAIHTVTNLDWRWPGTPGWPGQLRTGDHYILSLDDPHYPGLDYTFPQQLIVTGDNPNT